MKPILIVLSCFNRRDLTGVSLDSLKRAKSSLSDVLIIDDASTEYDEAWLKRWGFEVLRSKTTVGVGLAAYRRYQEFLNRGYAYICALDNDVVLAPRFDAQLLELFCEADDGNMTVASGYYSRTQSVYPPRGPRPHTYWQATTINGISQFTDVATTTKILNAMEGRWGHPWDANISKVLSKIVVPLRSLIQHLGVHGTGVNGMSDDIAVDFAGEAL